MRPLTTGMAVFRGVLTVTVIASAGCGSSPITSDRIETAIGRTFANLVHTQLSRLGLPAIAASDIAVRPSCRTLVPEHHDVGAGEWVCTLVWSGPNRQLLRDTYDLTVATNGCYTATLEGAEAELGGPTVTASDGTTVRNLLYAFDGCFDTTAPGR
jgi:hypothetical protein